MLGSGREQDIRMNVSGLKRKRVILPVAVVSIAVAAALYLAAPQGQQNVLKQCLAVDNTAPQDIHISGGTFIMGDEKHYPEEGPEVQVEVDDFWIDAHEVTNAQYSEFVNETGYVTVAERVPDPADYPGIDPKMLVAGSAGFVPPTDMSNGFNPLSWWRFIPGADWRHPAGPASSIEGMENYPVVHVAYEDAQAYAKWAGRKLPTEIQWEYAARGGLAGKTYAWGDEFTPDGEARANTWQGLFPVQNTEEDRFRGMAPVGCFKSNGYALYDMIGNVWEWTRSDFSPSHQASADAMPSGQSEGLGKVIKGGSFLCAPNYCMRYRPAARHAQDTGLGTDHIGFRTVSSRPYDLAASDHQ